MKRILLSPLWLLGKLSMLVLLLLLVVTIVFEMLVSSLAQVILTINRGINYVWR